MAAFRGAPFTERNDGTFRVDTDPRFVIARETLNWSIALIESLYQLRELVVLDEPKGKPETPLGHRAASVNVGHMLWAAVTAMGVLDRIAAAFGALQLGVLDNDKLYDFGKLWDDRSKIGNEPIRQWMKEVRQEPAYELLKLLRDPITHRTLRKRITVSIALSEVFEPTVPAGEPLPSYDHPDQLHLASGRTVGFIALLEEAMPFVERHMETALALLESGVVWPTDVETNN